MVFVDSGVAPELRVDPADLPPRPVPADAPQRPVAKPVDPWLPTTPATKRRRTLGSAGDRPARTVTRPRDGAPQPAAASEMSVGKRRAVAVAITLLLTAVPLVSLYLIVRMVGQLYGLL